jgi:uncharacterized protein
VDFEFDLRKSAINAGKHGIDFDAAQFLWEDPNRVEFIARFKDEERHGLVASHDSRLWCAIFTIRGEKIRIISVRRARTYEEELYNDSQTIRRAF